MVDMMTSGDHVSDGLIGYCSYFFKRRTYLAGHHHGVDDQHAIFAHYETGVAYVPSYFAVYVSG